MRYSDKQRIKKIYQKASELRDYVTANNVKKSDVMTNINVQCVATVFLYNMGEHAYYLSEEYKKSHSEIPWHQIAALRHRLVHNYDATNWAVVADTVFDDLPVLIANLEKLM